MYERRTLPLLPRRRFLKRLGVNFAIAAGVIGVSLLVGTLGYHYAGRLAWIDAFLNASMLLGGMGQVGEVSTTSGKLFASFFSLYSGLVLLAAASVVLAPVFHRLMHRLHLETSEASKEETQEKGNTHE